MSEGQETPRTRCLLYTDDGRCSNYKARRIRHDVFGMKDYDLCSPPDDYPRCEFFIEKPLPKK